MTGIYIITNKINDKRYIGQSVDINRRFWDHRCLSHEGNPHLRYSMKKYGKDAFTYEVLEECSIEELDEKERIYIEKLKPEYNVLPGGQGKRGHLPDSVKRNLREHGKKQWQEKTAEEKQRIIKNNLLCGGKIGHPVTEETRQKLRNHNLGKKQSKETIEKRKATIIQKKQNGYVQTNSGHKKKIVCVDDGKVFESVKDAAKQIGICSCGISAVLNNRQKSTHGYHFQYFEGVETNRDECNGVGRG